MIVIKFHQNYNVNGVTFVRNAEYQYLDKHEEYLEDRWAWIYRVDVGGVLYNIDGEYVVELDIPEDKYNKDYTKEEWRKKITRDAIIDQPEVKTKDYVAAWRATYGINKPVKDRADQADYDSEWEETRRRAEARYQEESLGR